VPWVHFAALLLASRDQSSGCAHLNLHLRLNLHLYHNNRRT